jgi:hypothetical protein
MIKTISRILLAVAILASLAGAGLAQGDKPEPRTRTEPERTVPIEPKPQAETIKLNRPKMSPIQPDLPQPGGTKLDHPKADHPKAEHPK